MEEVGLTPHLSRADKKVCIFKRGQEPHLGQYPRTRERLEVGAARDGRDKAIQ